MYTLEQLEKICERFKPICYLHKKEKYAPITLEAYLQTVVIRECDKDKTPSDDDNVVTDNPLVYFNDDDVVPYSADFERKNYYMVPKGYKYKNKFWKELINSSKEDQKNILKGSLNVNDLKNIPYYVEIDDETNENYIYISYCFFYGFNGAARILYSTIKIEDHFGDVENVSIRIKKPDSYSNSQIEESTIDNLQIDQIYYAAHGGGELVKDNSYDKDGVRPIVYTGINSHASYKKSGVYWRIFGYGNDITEKGVKWDPTSINIISINKNAKPVGDGRTKSLEENQISTAIPKKNSGLNAYDRTSAKLNLFNFYKYLGNLGFSGALPTKGNTGSVSVGSFKGQRFPGNTGEFKEHEPQGMYFNKYIYLIIIMSLMTMKFILNIKFKNTPIKIIIGILLVYLTSSVKLTLPKVYNILLALIELYLKFK